jgi:hypothetical protein
VSHTNTPHRLGIRITRGQIKLFADPLQSDIIVASPLALATKLAEDAAAARDAADGAAGGGGGGGRGGRGGRGGGRGRGRRGGGAQGAAAGGRGGGGASSSSSSSSGAADFLSSIEICVLERADVLLMQNWQHVNTGVWGREGLLRTVAVVDTRAASGCWSSIPGADPSTLASAPRLLPAAAAAAAASVLAALNQQPASLHGVNVMRVRMHHLEGRGALYRWG